MYMYVLIYTPYQHFFSFGWCAITSHFWDIGETELGIAETCDQGAGSSHGSSVVKKNLVRKPHSWGCRSHLYMGELTIVKVKPLPKWEDPSSNHHFCCANLIAKKGGKNGWISASLLRNSGISGCGIQHAIWIEMGLSENVGYCLVGSGVTPVGPWCRLECWRNILSILRWGIDHEQLNGGFAMFHQQNLGTWLWKKNTSSDWSLQSRTKLEG